MEDKKIKPARATGERFARSPSFVIEGEGEVDNPCTDEIPAADCVVEFLNKYDVNQVVVKDIGRRAENLLNENGISIVKETETISRSQEETTLTDGQKTVLLGAGTILLGGAIKLCTEFFKGGENE